MNFPDVQNRISQRKYHFDLPEEDEYQTLAGYILFSTGQIPAKGTAIELGDYNMEVIEKSANRLELIKISRKEED